MSQARRFLDTFAGDSFPSCLCIKSCLTCPAWSWKWTSQFWLLKFPSLFLIYPLGNQSHALLENPPARVRWFSQLYIYNIKLHWVKVISHCHVWLTYDIPIKSHWIPLNPYLFMVTPKLSVVRSQFLAPGTKLPWRHPHLGSLPGSQGTRREVVLDKKWRLQPPQRMLKSVKILPK